MIAHPPTTANADPDPTIGGRTEDRTDLEPLGEDLPYSLPGMRPARFEEVARQERSAYRSLLVPLRELRRKVFRLLRLEDQKAIRLRRKFEWDAYTQVQWDRAIREFLVEMQGSADIRAAATDWYFSEAALPTEWRLGTRIGIDRAMLITGAKEAATAQVNERFIRAFGDHAFGRLSDGGRSRIGIDRAMLITGAKEAATAQVNERFIRAFGDHAFERLSDSGRSRLGLMLDGPDVPGGSIRSIIEGAVSSGENPLMTARVLSERFDQYEKWEFTRLTRTEVAFAQEAGIREELREEGWVEMHGVDYPPYHPNCCCSTTVDFKTGLVMPSVSPSACEVCQAAGIAADIAAPEWALKHPWAGTPPEVDLAAMPDIPELPKVSWEQHGEAWRDVLPADLAEQRATANRIDATFRVLSDDEVKRVFAAEQMHPDGKPSILHLVNEWQQSGRLREVAREYESAVAAGRRGYARAQSLVPTYADEALGARARAEEELEIALRSRLLGRWNRYAEKLYNEQGGEVGVIARYAERRALPLWERWRAEAEPLVSSLEQKGNAVTARAYKEVEERRPEWLAAKQEMEEALRAVDALVQEGQDIYAISKGEEWAQYQRALERVSEIDRRTERGRWLDGLAVRSVEDAEASALETVTKHWMVPEAAQAEVKRALADLYRVSDESVIDALNRRAIKVQTTKDAPYAFAGQASRGGYADNVIELTDMLNRRTIIHEALHHIEYSATEAVGGKPLGAAWRDLQAPAPTRLVRIKETYGRGYEWQSCRPDGWKDPYTMVVYDQGTSEVLSQAARWLDHFEAADTLTPLERSQLDFVIGILRGGIRLR